MRLTPEGRRWALAHAETSIVARVALAVDRGEETDWPEPFRQTSVKVANEEAS